MPQPDDVSQNTFQITPTVVAHMMTPGVVQVPGDVSVSEAALLLEREHASCLLVKETDSTFGLMTPSDIVKKVVAQGLEPHEIEIRSIMSRPVQFIEYDVALEEACTMMVATGTSLLIVTKQNQPVGVLSAQDLMLTPRPRHAQIPTIMTVVNEAITEHQSHNAMIVQLSHTGARVESAMKIARKARVILAFSLPGHNNPLTVRGRVMTCELPQSNPSLTAQHAFAIDIQFSEVSNHDQARLKAWALQALPPSSSLPSA